MSGERRPRVVVVGCGFGGLAAIRALEKAPVEVLAVDRNNYHLFQPLLYQVASAALTPAEIAVPVRSILSRQKNTVVVLGAVESVDPVAKRVHTGEESYRYDYLVLAAGAVDNYFGHDGWKDRAPGLKSLGGALELRSRMLLAFEEAEVESDEAARRRKLTFVVIGGGPTGVEMAGSIKELAVDVIPEDFRLFDSRTTRVVLIEGGDRLLPTMDPRSSAIAKRDLERMGVEVVLGSQVTGITEDAVLYGDRTLPCGNVIWAAGITGSPIAGTLGSPLARGGRVTVAADLSVPGHPEVFVIGDLAAAVSADSGEPVPGVAQGAIQMGRHAARVIRTELRTGSRDPVPPFSYRDKGTMATIGRSRAVAELFGRVFGGFPAWLIWSTIHVAFLIGWRNRLVTFLSWVQSYLFFRRGSRLITGERLPSVVNPVDGENLRTPAAGAKD